jgi:hypothetical protein
MVWKTLGESLEAALASMLNEVGDEVAGTRLDAVNGSKRGPDAETPGQVAIREVVPTSSREQTAPVNPANGRPIVTAQTKRRPTSAVAIGLVLVVDNGEGGRPARGGGSSRAAYAQAGGGNPASNLVVIEGGRRHWTASAF